MRGFSCRQLTGIGPACVAAAFVGIVAGQGCLGGEEAIEPEMVRIPGGEFMMGTDHLGDSYPRHKVRISPFSIDKYEVTNAQYQAFCETTDHALPFYWGMDEFKSGPDYPNHPVLGVSMSSALAYARWRDARLPTEAEWEYAARGGLEGKYYSHGDEHDSTLYVKSHGTGPMQVGSFPPNGYGLHDMTGNVCEWVNDRYGRDYYSGSPERDPTGPSAGNYRLIRGGGWHTGPSCSRVYFRTALKSNWLDFNVGFRCAQYVGASAAEHLETLVRETGLPEATREYDRLRASDGGDFYFNEMEINEMAYRLHGDGLTEQALAVCEWNAAAYPQSHNAWDSLAEILAALDHRELAIECYRKALGIHPWCQTSKDGLAKLGLE